VCIIILYAPMPRCGSGLGSRENEGATVRRNATGNGLPLWQQEKRTDDGQPGRCSPTLCCQVPLESLSSQMRVQEHPMGRLRNMRAEGLRWSLNPG